MKFIKRISALIPAVLVLLFSVVPLSSSAEVDLNPDSAGFLSEQFADFEDFSPYYSVENPSTYIIYQSYVSISSSKYNPWYRAVTHFIDLSDAEYSYVDGVYYWDFSNYSQNLVEWEGEYRYNTENGTLSESSGYIQKHAAYSVTLDTNKHEFYVNDYKFPNSYFSIHPSEYLHFNLTYVIDGIKPDSSNGIEVDTFPKLEGDSTLNMYLLDDDGYPIPGKTSDRYLSTQLIDIDVKNNSTKPFQFCLYFAEKGGTLELNTQYREFLGSRFYSNNPLFVYLTEENFYNYDITSHMNRTVNAVSCYHLVQPGQTFTCHVGENQLDLKKGVEYDLVVFGAFIDNHTNAYLENHILDTQFSIFNISGMDPYISLSGSGFDCKEFYRSTFVLDKTSDYKNTQYSNSGDLQIGGLGTSYNNGANQNNDNVFNTIYGQTDQNGNSSYKNTSFSENYGSYHMSYGDGSGLSSISNISLSSSFSSVFGMVTDFFNKLPKGMQDAFTFGFTAVIVIGIIKAVT